MNGKVTDEMLMAYVDGELDPGAHEEVRRAIEGNVEIAARAEMFRKTRNVAKAAFADLLATTPPKRLVDAIASENGAKIVRFPARRTIATTLPLAASIAIAFGLAGYWWGQNSMPSPEILGASPVAAALSRNPAGEPATVRLGDAQATLTALSSFPVEGGYCRMFELSGDGLATAMRGVGCGRGDDWTIDIAVASSGEDGGYAPASAGLTESIDIYLDAKGAGAPLSDEEEQRTFGDEAQ